MVPQTSTNTQSHLDIFSLPVHQRAVFPYDDEEQLAVEMAQALSEHVQDQPLPDIDPDDFEKIYRWFLS